MNLFAFSIMCLTVLCSSPTKAEADTSAPLIIEMDEYVNDMIMKKKEDSFRVEEGLCR